MNPTAAARLEPGYPRRRRRHPAIALPLAAFALAAIVVISCWQVAGVSLGLFFGGVAAATLVVPPLAAAATVSAMRWIVVPCAAALGAAGVWLFTRADAFTWTQWFACAWVLAAYAVALGGIVAAVVALRVPHALAAGAATVAGMLWLTWPVWLSHALLTSGGDTLVAWLVPAHPLFAINGVLAHFDAWDRLPLAYTRLSNLNQDVSYVFPSSVVPAVLVHMVVGLIFGGAAMLIEWCRRQKLAPATSPADDAPAGR